jgi:hypothetical protein
MLLRLISRIDGDLRRPTQLTRQQAPDKRLAE